MEIKGSVGFEVSRLPDYIDEFLLILEGGS